ncbi:MAG: GGDEF domain-containing protein [Gemmatimonadota bacterium]|jgi:diguanylate cyclase (GGDEF)-like protein|nr:GGDEF domain-containing protein [Gemmatimonadota bacterium]
MTSPLVPSVLGGLTSAVAAACHQARTEVELYERCRDALVRTFGSEALWLTITAPTGTARVGPDSPNFADALEIFRCRAGETELVVHCDPAMADAVRGMVASIGFGLGVALELRSVLLDRQAALDDASFQLRALRQVVRLLSSVHSAEETEHLILDFMAEVFFAWWAVLLRPQDGRYVPHKSRSLVEGMTFEPVDGLALDRVLPPGSPVTTPDEVGVGALVPPAVELVVPLDAGGERLALLLLGPRINGKPFGRPEKELSQTLALAAAIALKNAELVERLHSAATTDGLTGLLNRRAIEERLGAEISRSSRHQVRTTIALIDLDRFKLINDTLGHAAGDRYLVHLGEMLRRTVRSLDVAGRLGGDEFLVILPMTSSAEARIFADRFQRGLEKFNELHPEFGLATVSIGLATAPDDGTNLAALLAAADSALYRAKGGGRNLIESAGSA